MYPHYHHIQHVTPFYEHLGPWELAFMGALARDRFIRDGCRRLLTSVVAALPPLTAATQLANNYIATLLADIYTISVDDAVMLVVLCRLYAQMGWLLPVNPGINMPLTGWHKELMDPAILQCFAPARRPAQYVRLLEAMALDLNNMPTATDASILSSCLHGSLVIAYIESCAKIDTDVGVLLSNFEMLSLDAHD